MKAQRNKPNYSMYLPRDLRKKIDALIAEEEFSSVAHYMIEAAKFYHKFHFGN